MKNWSKLKRGILIFIIGFFGLAALGSVTDSDKNNIASVKGTNIQNTDPQPSIKLEPAEPQPSPVQPPTPTPPPPPPTVPPPAPVPSTPPPAARSSCDPNYSGCVPIASDVDCAGGSGNGPAYVAGPIRVVGSDIYGLDRDGDGIACE